MKIWLIAFNNMKNTLFCSARLLFPFNIKTQYFKHTINYQHVSVHMSLQTKRTTKRAESLSGKIMTVCWDIQQTREFNDSVTRP